MCGGVLLKLFVHFCMQLDYEIRTKKKELVRISLECSVIFTANYACYFLLNEMINYYNLIIV